MQVHGPTSSGDRIDVTLNPGGGRPFAVVAIDTIRIYVETPAEADKLIKATIAAKSLLLGETSEPAGKHGRFDAGSAAAVAQGVEPPHRADGDEVICGAESEPQFVQDPSSVYVCTAQAGHAGPDHVAFSPGSGIIHRWPVASPDTGNAFPHVPHLPQHQGSSPTCVMCGIDHDAAARLAPPAMPETGEIPQFPAAYGLPPIELANDVFTDGA